MSMSWTSLTTSATSSPCKEGDLLVCEGGEPGRSAVWKLDADMAFQNAIHRVRVAEAYSPDFIGLQFEWLAGGGALDQFFTGVTIKHFSQQNLRRVPLVVPSLHEQEEIVRILDTQLARLDTVLAAVQAVRDKADQFRRSLLHAAFTGQLTQPDPARGDSLPSRWGTVQLDDFAGLTSGFAYKSSMTEAGVPVVKIANVRNGRVDMDGCDFISKDLAGENREVLCSAGRFDYADW